MDSTIFTPNSLFCFRILPLNPLVTWSLTIYLKLQLPIMDGRFQSFAIFLILLSFLSLGILDGMSRPMNILVLHGDADQIPKSTIPKPSYMVVRSIIRKLEVDQAGPSPQGKGHNSPPWNHQLNN